MLPHAGKFGIFDPQRVFLRPSDISFDFLRSVIKCEKMTMVFRWWTKFVVGLDSGHCSYSM